MAEDLSEKIEQKKIKIEKPLNDSGFSPEVEQGKFNPEKEISFDSGGEDKKALEKQGEALKKAKKIIPVVSSEERERKEMIEKILSEGLDDVFLSMNPKKQKEFKEEGEKTISKINILLNKTKFSVEKIISLIRSWLRIIPSVNRFFLEQEAKIKADKIIKLKK